MAILKVLVLCANGVRTTDVERRAIVRTWVWSVCIILAMTALLIVPPYYNFTSGIKGSYPARSLVTTLVPQAVPLAIPIGIAFGLAFGLAVRPTLNLVKRLLVGAIAASALSLCVLVWAMPAGNQAFREHVFYNEHRGPPSEVVLEKGYNEMTVSELRREIARFTTNGEHGEARLTEFRMHLRIALAGASLALVCVLLAAPVNNRGWRGLLAFAVCFAYWALMFIGEAGMRRGYLPPSLGAWLPNVVLIVTAIIIASSRSSRLRGSFSSAGQTP